MDNDGEPECYVGFWGVAGVHGLNLEGERLWINRDYSAVTSLAVSTPNEIGWRRLLVTGESGGILKINKVGHQDPELKVKQWQIGQLISADFTAQQAQYLGLSQDDRTKQLVAVALDADFQPQWDYPLPPGMHSHPLEFLQPADILQDKRGAWLLAGADGTIHVVSEDGEFSDSFAIGAASPASPAGNSATSVCCWLPPRKGSLPGKCSDAPPQLSRPRASARFCELQTSVRSKISRLALACGFC